MQTSRQEEGSGPLMDQSFAEQTLLLAARLQHEHKERLSLQELKQTAAEAEIGPEFVEEAFSLLQRRSEAPLQTEPEVQKEKPRARTWFANLGVGFLVLLLQFAAMSAVHGPVKDAVPGWVTIAVIVGLAGYFFPKGRRWSHVLAVSALVGCVFTLLSDWMVWNSLTPSAREGYWEHLCVLIPLELFGFIYAQRIGERIRGESGPVAEPLRASISR